jgi:hypothetical protein
MVGCAISGVGPQEERAIVFEVDPIAEVTVPRRVVIIGVPREVGTDERVDNKRSRFCNHNGSGGYNGKAYSDMPEAGTGAYNNLGIAFRCQKAGGYDRGEDK